MQVPLVNGRPVEYGFQPPRRSRPILIGAIILASAMVLLPLIFGIRWLSPRFDLPSAAGSLDADILKAKAAGIPMVASDLAPVPSIPPSENAAPAVEKAIANWKQLGISSHVMGDLLQALYAGDYKDADKTLKDPKLSSLLTLAKRAADFPKCDFNKDYDLGSNVYFPEYEGLKQLIKLLSWRAECEAQAGDHAAAVSDLRAAYHLSLDAGSDPIIISNLVEIACDSIVLASAERCLADAKTPSDAQPYVDFLNAPRPAFDNVRELKGEAYIGMATIRNLALFSMHPAVGDKPAPIDPSKLQRSGMPTSLVGRAYMARHFEVWSEAVDAAKLLQGDPLSLFSQVTAITNRVEKEQGFSYSLEKILAPVYEQIGIAQLRNEAMWNSEGALSKVMLYRAQHGSFPGTLEEAGASKTDPFSDQPLKYLRSDSGVKVYSVGQDLQDDHGARRSDPAPGGRHYERTTWDEVASYPPPVHIPLPRAQNAVNSKPARPPLAAKRASPQ